MNTFKGDQLSPLACCWQIRESVPAAATVHDDGSGQSVVMVNVGRSAHIMSSSSSFLTRD